MSATVNPEITELRDKLEVQGKALRDPRQPQSTRQDRKRHDSPVSVATDRADCQLVLSLAIAGGLAYQTTMIDKRIDQIERRLDERFNQMEQRIEQVEKNLTSRFEDLKQEVRSRTK